MRSIEYVASGTSHLKILNLDALKTPEVVDLANEIFSTVDNSNNHRFSLLYNAFTEKNFGEKFKELYSKSIYTIHADSGGLQIITQGKSITNSLKDDIYRNQARSSDIAMCFDEIPIGVVGERSDRNDTTGRYFDYDNLEAYARETGRNIKRQIEIFLEEKSTAKPMIIAQGNCYETYMSWVEYILKEIPSSYYQYIGGIAMGAAALGTGPLEDIERAAYATKLPFQMDEPYIHVLGVGSVRRLLPYLALAKSGYYPDNLHLSYDSTTHTSGVNMGMYYLDGGTTLGRNFSEIYNTIFDDVNQKYDLSNKNVDIQTFHRVLNTDTSYYLKDNSIDLDMILQYYNVRLSFAASSIRNFTARIDKCLKSKNHLLKIAGDNNVSKEIYSLLNISTIEDFLEWKNLVSGSTKTKRISGTRPATLEGFL